MQIITALAPKGSARVSTTAGEPVYTTVRPGPAFVHLCLAPAQFPGNATEGKGRFKLLAVLSY